MSAKQSDNKMSLTEAVSETRKFSSMIEALGRLSDVADSFIGIDQTVRERSAEADRLAGVVSQSKAELAKANEAIEKAKKDTAELIAKASADGKAILDATKASASRVEASAKEAESQALARAEAALNKERESLDRLNSTRKEMADISERIVSAREAAIKAFGS